MVSGVPTETEVQDQWRKAIDIIDQTRVFADSLTGASQEYETLMGVLKGDFLPEFLSNWSSRHRAVMSSAVDPAFIDDVITPCILEYGKVLRDAGTVGSGYEDAALLKQSIYEHFIANTLRVETRAIVYDSTATVTGTGNGNVARMTEDDNGFDLEGCHVEKKVFRCRRDQNSGTRELAEEFEMIAETPSKDNLEQTRTNGTTGSGTTETILISSRNAGSGTTGSILNNSSFSTFPDTTFTSWDLVSGTQPTQDLVNFYISTPTTETDAALTASADFRLKQTLANMKGTRLDPVQPYFLRVMVNASEGLASGGSFHLHLGSRAVVSTTIASLSAGWNEIIVPLDKDAWFKNFNGEDFDVEIEWSGSVSGSLLVDDIIFVAMTRIDGTYWTIRQNAATPVSWLVDDEIAFTDTQADTTAGKIQYYLWRAGFGYLPHDTIVSTNITFLDP